jgi:hypothetical protein
MHEMRISGQKDTQAAAAPTRIASGSQWMSACIRVGSKSQISGWAYTPGRTAWRLPLRTNQSMVLASFGVLAASDYTVGHQELLNVMLQSPHTY